MTTKICHKCNVDKPFSEFPKGRDSNGLYYICKLCTTARNQKLYSQKEPRRRWVDSTFSDTKGRAARKGVDFTLTKDLLYSLFESQTCMCVYCTRPFDFSGTNSERRGSPSIDRIIPERGYIACNVVLACHRCNAIKNDASLAELQQIAKTLAILLRDVNPTVGQSTPSQTA